MMMIITIWFNDDNDLVIRIWFNDAVVDDNDDSNNNNNDEVTASLRQSRISNVNMLQNILSLSTCNIAMQVSMTLLNGVPRS